MKAKHAGAQSRKHGCPRCHSHKSVVRTFVNKVGRKYCLCEACIKSRPARQLREATA